jgi:hypothetical protein
MIDAQDRIELEPLSSPVETGQDKRPRMENLPPVRLVAVEDCVLEAVAGLEVELDQFYAALLGFEREADPYEIVYRAENVRLRINVMECPPLREDFRALGVAVPSLGELARKLDENKIEFVRQRGLAPGQDTVLVSDPAGNPVEISEFHLII